MVIQVLTKTHNVFCSRHQGSKGYEWSIIISPVGPITPGGQGGEAVIPRRSGSKGLMRRRADKNMRMWKIHLYFSVRIKIRFDVASKTAYYVLHLKLVISSLRNTLESVSYDSLKVIYHPLYGMNNYVLIWGEWLSCDPLRGSHDSQSPHIRKHLCLILWQLWFICHKIIHTI